MIETFLNARDMFVNFMGNYHNLIWFVLSLVLCFFLLKSRENFRFFLWFALLLLVIYCFPVSAWIITKLGIEKAVYWRLLWLLPMTLVTAYGLTLLIRKLKKLPLQLAGVILCGALLVVTGTSIYQSGLFQKAPNAYKLPESVFGVCDTILADAGDTPVKAVMPDDLTWYVRQYTSRINLAYGRDGGKDNTFDTPEETILYNVMHNPQPHMESLKQGMILAGCNYVVLSTDDTRNTQMTESGFTGLAIIDNYAVYRIN